jgi:hypothetical protein
VAMNPEQDDAAIQNAAKKVASGLAAGRPRTSVAQDLVADGWSHEDANSFVASVEEALLEDPPSSRGSAVKGWLFWIGALLLFNLLSWLFEWPIFLF